MVLCADAASAQRVIRQAFEPAVTPFLGATGFDLRVRSLESSAFRFGYDNGVVVGVQLERPWTRRTALMGSVSLAPLSHVVEDVADGGRDLERVAVLGVDAGVAGRLKPSAAIFGFAGGGAMLATRPPGNALSGVHVEPRLTLGVGLDAGRRSRTGVRFAYLAHYVFTHSPNAAYSSEGNALDWTFVLGLRRTLGTGGAEAGR